MATMTEDAVTEETATQEISSEATATAQTYQCPTNFSERMSYIGLDPEDPELAMFACSCDHRRHWLESKKLW